MNLEPPPPPPPRLSSCHLHPDQPVTGFCASCLRERLAGLESASSNSLRKSPASSSSTAAAALRAIFTRGESSSRARASKSLLPELRRCKSFSGAKADGVVPILFEPQRKSCDVRARNTLWSLFHQDDENKGGTSAWAEIEEEEEQEQEDDNEKPISIGRNANLVFDEVREDIEEEDDNEGEIRVLETEIKAAAEPAVGAEREIEQVVEEEEEEEEEEGEEDMKTMKDHIDLGAQTNNQPGNKATASTNAEKRDLKEIAGSFWLAASVFSKKLQKWRRKKKRDCRKSSAASVRAERPASSSRFFRETQSEVADYGFGRRSCDTDPRFSLDAGRISFDDARYSFDEPRASWDGYLIGRTHPAAAAAFPRVPLPMMDSVVEDAPALVRRSDNQIPVEDPMNSIEEDPIPTTPGGSVQTRDYYLDSSSSLRRWQSLQRSSSLRGMETDETKWVSNSKVSPESMDYFLANKFADSRDSVPNSSSLRDDCSESFESAYREAATIAVNGGLRKGSSRKSRRWIKVWNIWGLIHRRGGGSGSKDDDYDRYSRGNVVDRSFSESWPELRREVNGENGDSRGTFNSRVSRSNSSVSWRNSFSNGTFCAMKSSKEANGHSKKRREEFVLERNRSARFSPSHFDNGLLRFYLTPLRSSWSGGGGGSGKSRMRSSHSFVRSMLGLY